MIPAAHLNETLKRVLPVIGHAKPHAVARALQSPYLTFDGSYDEGVAADESTFVGIKDDWGMIRTPFPLFRYCCATIKRTIFGLCERREREMIVVACVREKSTGQLGPVCWAITFRGEPDGMSFDGRMFDSRTMEDITGLLKEADAVSRVTDKDFATVGDLSYEDKLSQIAQHRRGVQTLERAVGLLRGQHAALEAIQELSTKTPPLDGPEIKDQFMAFYGTVLLLAYNYLAPHSFMARVTPAKEGKSVEWLRAREHYTVIHRHHAANNATVTEGSTVSGAGNLQRLAHSRRAHTKLLKHERYKFKRGRRIFVRATWVGPKEWRDTAGQIYQILTPVA